MITRSFALIPACLLPFRKISPHEHEQVLLLKRYVRLILLSIFYRCYASIMRVANQCELLFWKQLAFMNPLVVLSVMPASCRSRTVEDLIIYYRSYVPSPLRTEAKIVIKQLEQSGDDRKPQLWWRPWAFVAPKKVTVRVQQLTWTTTLIAAAVMVACYVIYAISGPSLAGHIAWLYSIHSSTLLSSLTDRLLGREVDVRISLGPLGTSALFR